MALHFQQPDIPRTRLAPKESNLELNGSAFGQISFIAVQLRNVEINIFRFARDPDKTKAASVIMIDRSKHLVRLILLKTLIRLVAFSNRFRSQARRSDLSCKAW